MKIRGIIIMADRGRSDLTVHLSDLRYAQQGTSLAYCGVLVPVPNGGNVSAFSDYYAYDDS